MYLVFAAKSLFLASLGVLMGYGCALLTSQWLTGTATVSGLFDPTLLVKLFAFSACVSVFASLVPTVLAARQDPGLVLNEDG